MLVPTDSLEQTLDLGELEADAEQVTASYDGGNGECICDQQTGQPEGGLLLYYYDGDVICGHLSPTAVLSRAGDFWSNVD